MLTRKYTTMKILLAMVSLLTLILQGCVVMPTTESLGVRVVDNQSDYNCRFITTVTGSGSMGWTPAHDAEGAINQIRNRAAQAGGNAVHILNADSSALTSTIMAEALSCDF